MDKFLIGIGIFIFICSIIAFIIYFIYFITQFNYLFGYLKKHKYGKARIKEFDVIIDEYNNIISGVPYIQFKNEFTGEIVIKKMSHSGILFGLEARKKYDSNRMVDIGSEVSIEYTPKKVRVIDNRFVPRNKYHLINYTVPLIVSIVFSLIGLFIIFIGIQ